MYRVIIIFALLMPFNWVQAEIVEVDIHGMTCAFCVEGLQQQLSKLPDVAKVEVSLKFKKVRIQSIAGQLDMERVREAIIDAGYTPVESRQIAHDSG